MFLNFPVALAALPLIVLAAERLTTWAATLVGLLALVLCLVVAWPGVVDEDDLDAKAANAVPAAGVALAVALTAAAGLLGVRARLPRVAIATLVVLALMAIPWIAADLGFHLDGVPVLGSVFLTGKQVGPLAAVHLGHHHGMDGVLLAAAALLTIPLVGRIRIEALRIAVGVWLGLQLAYGLANAVQDFWLEQVVKRGWTDSEMPGVLHPAASWVWLGILAAAAAFSLAILRAPRQRAQRARRRAP